MTIENVLRHKQQQTPRGWVEVPAAPDVQKRNAVREALIHHLETMGIDWLLSVMADAITNVAIRRLNEEQPNRLQSYNILRGYADAVDRLGEREAEWAGYTHEVNGV
jgi:hypothetical protein